MQVSLSAIGTLDALLEYAQALRGISETPSGRIQEKTKEPPRKLEGPQPVFISQWNRRILTRSIPGHTGRHQEASQPACLQAQRGNPRAGERR
jgi:hypothetical protein